MRIVLDVCVPEPFRHELEGHDVVTARFLGLHRLEDGAIIASIEGSWDVFITCDRGIPWQNQFAGRSIAVIVLCARTNTLKDLIELVPDLRDALDVVRPGEVREISA